MKSAHLFAVVCLSFFLSGCISHVSVKRVAPNPEPTTIERTMAKIRGWDPKPPKPPRGLRYYLPQRILVGTPNPSGKIEYSIEYLPDPDHQYAIDSWSLMASHSAKFTRSEQLFLTKAEIAQDTTAIAKKLLEAGGTLGADVVTEIAEQRTKAANAAANAEVAKKTAADKIAAEKATATKEQKAAQLKLDKANAAVERAQKKLQDLENATPPNEAAIAEAKKALELAIAAADDAALDARAAQSSLAAFDEPSKGPKRTETPGPVVYLIKEDPQNGISLVPLNFQLRSPSSDKPETGTQLRLKSIEIEKKKDPPKDSKSDNSVTMETEVAIPLGEGEKLIADKWKVMTIPKSGRAAQDVTSEFTFKPGNSALVVRLKELEPGQERRVTAGKYLLTYKITSNDEGETVERTLNIL